MIKKILVRQQSALISRKSSTSKKQKKSSPANFAKLKINIEKLSDALYNQQLQGSSSKVIYYDQFYSPRQEMDEAITPRFAPSSTFDQCFLDSCEKIGNLLPEKVTNGNQGSKYEVQNKMQQVVYKKKESAKLLNVRQINGDLRLVEGLTAECRQR